MGQCQVSVMIPIQQEDPWSVTIMGVELDDVLDKTAHFALTSLRGSRTETAAMPLVLFLFRYQGDPVWQQCFEPVSDPKVPHYHAGMAAMAEYAQGLFNLQHSTDMKVVRSATLPHHGSLHS
jgi:hypothetical protein